MKRIVLSSLLLFVLFTTLAQSDSDSLGHQKFLTLVNANRNQSYITFGNGLGNMQPILFEATLSPSYFFSKRRQNWALLLNPQVQMRMLDQASWPIRTPGFKLYVYYYHDVRFWQNTFLRKIFYKNALWFVNAAHHSNGQSGNFYSDSTQNVNVQDGNFSTSYVEVGISSYTMTLINDNYFSIREFKVYAELHPKILASEGLDSSYGLYRIHAKLGINGLVKQFKNDFANRWLQQSSFEIKSGWIFGSMNGVSQVDLRKRWMVDLTYKYYPSWFDELAFFVRFYHGQDYYNIHYTSRPLSAVSIGITSNIMNFKQAVKYLK